MSSSGFPIPWYIVMRCHVAEWVGMRGDGSGMGESALRLRGSNRVLVRTDHAQIRGFLIECGVSFESRDVGSSVRDFGQPLFPTLVWWRGTEAQHG